MTSYNGANNHNVESILASIRSTIGDEHDPRAPGRGPVRAAASAPAQHRPAPIADEASEFELPAIFKPGHPSSLGDARPNLFGRLSDALKPSAPVEPDRSRTVIRFEPASAGRMIDPPAPPATAHASRSEPQSYPDPTAKVSADNEGVRREMTSFFDTRMKMMAPAPRREPEPEPLPPPIAAPPRRFELPPALPDRADAQDMGGFGMEDAAAQMMRPILRQWLTDNMPRIVEKALRHEASTDSGDHQPPPRKTLR
ncbi:MAG: DUF2497 domain-containing protein [Hyphomicrobium sp.]